MLAGAGRGGWFGRVSGLMAAVVMFWGAWCGPARGQSAGGEGGAQAESRAGGTADGEAVFSILGELGSDQTTFMVMGESFELMSRIAKRERSLLAVPGLEQILQALTGLRSVRELPASELEKLRALWPTQVAIGVPTSQRNWFHDHVRWWMKMEEFRGLVLGHGLWEQKGFLELAEKKLAELESLGRGLKVPEVTVAAEFPTAMSAGLAYTGINRILEGMVGDSGLLVWERVSATQRLYRLDGGKAGAPGSMVFDTVDALLLPDVFAEDLFGDRVERYRLAIRALVDRPLGLMVERRGKVVVLRLGSRPVAEVKERLDPREFALRGVSAGQKALGAVHLPADAEASKGALALWAELGTVRTGVAGILSEWFLDDSTLQAMAVVLEAVRQSADAELTRFLLEEGRLRMVKDSAGLPELAALRKGAVLERYMPGEASLVLLTSNLWLAGVGNHARVFLEQELTMHCGDLMMEHELLVEDWDEEGELKVNEASEFDALGALGRVAEGLQALEKGGDAWMARSAELLSAPALVVGDGAGAVGRFSLLSEAGELSFEGVGMVRVAVLVECADSGKLAEHLEEGLIRWMSLEFGGAWPEDVGALAEKDLGFGHRTWVLDAGALEEQFEVSVEMEGDFVPHLVELEKGVLLAGNSVSLTRLLVDRGRQPAGGAGGARGEGGAGVAGIAGPGGSTGELLKSGQERGAGMVMRVDGAWLHAAVEAMTELVLRWSHEDVLADASLAAELRGQYFPELRMMADVGERVLGMVWQRARLRSEEWQVELVP